jgi:hypothetical protein
MRTLILFIATLVASFLAALNLNGQDAKEIVRKADTKLNIEKSIDSEIKKNRLEIATFTSFTVLLYRTKR